MEKKITAWHGIDASKEESLIAYGCLARYLPKNKRYEVIYRHPYIWGNWDFGFMEEEDPDSFLQESWFEKDRFLNYLGMTETEWLELSFIQKVHDLITWENVINFFGEPNDEGMSTKEVCKKVRIAYDESYELN